MKATAVQDPTPWPFLPLPPNPPNPVNPVEKLRWQLQRSHPASRADPAPGDAQCTARQNVIPPHSNSFHGDTRSAPGSVPGRKYST